MEWLPLLGLLVIVVGFILKLDTLFILILSALTTALLAGISIDNALSMLGEFFIANRVVTLFLLPIPMIALVERFGLKEQASLLIGKLHNLTAPILLYVYLIIREVALMFGMPLGGHPQFIRPLIYPMAEAAAEKNGELTEKEKDILKAKAAATENIGNFFSQNVFTAGAGVLLIASTLNGLNYTVSVGEIAFTALLVAIISLVVMLVPTLLWHFKEKDNRKGGKKHG